MSDRNYEKNPVIVEVTIRVCIYEDVPSLESKLEQVNKDRHMEEAAGLLVGGFFSEDFGLDHLEFKKVTNDE